MITPNGKGNDQTNGNAEASDFAGKVAEVAG